MDAQISQYFSQAAKDGVKLTSGKMEYANIMEQGGLASARRVLKKCKKPYNAQSFYNAMSKDTGNQVGAYKARQRFVYNTIINKVGNR